jgi:hypothetical protein
MPSVTLSPYSFGTQGGPGSDWTATGGLPTGAELRAYDSNRVLSTIGAGGADSRPLDAVDWRNEGMMGQPFDHPNYWNGKNITRIAWSMFAECNRSEFQLAAYLANNDKSQSMATINQTITGLAPNVGQWVGLGSFAAGLASMIGWLKGGMLGSIIHYEHTLPPGEPIPTNLWIDQVRLVVEWEDPPAAAAEVSIWPTEV